MLEFDDNHVSDETDLATMRELIAQDTAVRDVQLRAAAMPAGEPGDCDMCGEWSGRLVGGACAPCRDKYKLP